MAALSTAESLQLVGAAKVARLATVTAEGAAHVVPCCFALDGQALYSIIDGKPKSTTALRRLANVSANPQVSLVIDHYSDDWIELWWVRLDGRAAVVDEQTGTTERAAAIERLQAKYPQYVTDVPNGPLLRVDITSVTGWAYDVTRIPEEGR